MVIVDASDNNVPKKILKSDLGIATSGAGVTVDLDVMPDWDLIWEFTTTTNERGLTTAGSTNRNLMTGKSFADYDTIIAWIDNNVNTEGKFMWIQREHFATIFISTAAGGGWVDWSDGGWIGLKYVDDTTFHKSGGGMGLRKLYGINGTIQVTGTEWPRRCCGGRWCYGRYGRCGCKRRNRRGWCGNGRDGRNGRTKAPIGPTGPIGPQGPAGQDGGGGGGGLTTAGINALTEIGADEIHSNDNLPGTATVGGVAVLRKFSLSRITNFLRSSVGLGKELVPEADTTAHSGAHPHTVNAGGTGYTTWLCTPTSSRALRPYPDCRAAFPQLRTDGYGLSAPTTRGRQTASP